MGFWKRLFTLHGEQFPNLLFDEMISSFPCIHQPRMPHATQNDNINPILRKAEQSPNHSTIQSEKHVSTRQCPFTNSRKFENLWRTSGVKKGVASTRNGAAPAWCNDPEWNRCPLCVNLLVSVLVDQIILKRSHLLQLCFLPDCEIIIAIFFV
jgi:hypothetical protein